MHCLIEILPIAPLCTRVGCQLMIINKAGVGSCQRIILYVLYLFIYGEVMFWFIKTLRSFLKALSRSRHLNNMYGFRDFATRYKAEINRQSLNFKQTVRPNLAKHPPTHPCKFYPPWKSWAVTLETRTT